MPHSPALMELLTQLSRGEMSADEVASHLTAPDASKLGVLGPRGDEQQAIAGATIDLGRESRCGFGEVIFGAGKSPELITEIVRAKLDVGQSSLITRIEPTIATQVRRRFGFGHHNPLAHTLRISEDAIATPRPIDAQAAETELHAAVVTAGSTDAPVAEEAVETLDWMGIPFQRFDDIGVAGPQRLLQVVPQLRLASSIVVVAGMEGALPATVAGHVATAVFAVPTSVGYGANLGGITPLLSMLNACAAGVAVVNIDAGFKGGYLAGLVVGQLQRRLQEPDA